MFDLSYTLMNEQKNLVLVTQKIRSFVLQARDFFSQNLQARDLLKIALNLVQKISCMKQDPISTVFTFF